MKDQNEVERTLCCHAPSPEALAKLRAAAFKCQEAAKEISVIQNAECGVFSSRFSDLLHEIDLITAKVKK